VQLKALSAKYSLLTAKFCIPEQSMHTALVVNNIYEEIAMNRNFVSATITGGVLVALVSNAFAEDYKRASLDAPAGVQAVQGQDLLPPNAQPGECYARVYVPPTFETFETKVLKADASQTLAIQPAEFENVTEEVVVEEASHRLEVVPAQYEWVEERIEVEPAHTKLKKVPAKYDTVSEKIVDKPARTVWKKGRGPHEKVNNATGEIMCLVEVPATYKTITKQIVAQPPRVEKVEIPAKYKTVKRKVLKNPATTQRVEIPAKTKTVTRLALKTPARELAENLPAQYQTVTQTRQVSGGSMEWQAVLCETNSTRSKIKRIQQALADEGYNPGGIDGSFGRQTGEAIKSFQRDQGLATGGITLETLRKLGVGA